MKTLLPPLPCAIRGPLLIFFLHTRRILKISSNQDLHVPGGIPYSFWGHLGLKAIEQVMLSTMTDPSVRRMKVTVRSLHTFWSCLLILCKEAMKQKYHELCILYIPCVLVFVGIFFEIPLSLRNGKKKPPFCLFSISWETKRRETGC